MYCVLVLCGCPVMNQAFLYTRTSSISLWFKQKLGLDLSLRNVPHLFLHSPTDYISSHLIQNYSVSNLPKTHPCFMACESTFSKSIQQFHIIYFLHSHTNDDVYGHQINEGYCYSKPYN